jgi:hypothetical protein
VPANDRHTVGELLADGDAVSGETIFEASSSQRPAIVRWPPLSYDDGFHASRPVHLSERTA